MSDAASLLRQAWEAGFALCRSYGDNHAHFDGEQKERQWQSTLRLLHSKQPPVVINQLTCDLGTGFDLQKFCRLLYIQYRYVRSLGIDHPVFVFTLPSAQRDLVEGAIIRMWKEMYGGDIVTATRTDRSTILGVDAPRLAEFHLHYPMVTIVLMDQIEWEKMA